MPILKTVKPPKPKNIQYYWIGLAILILNKIRHSIQGYTTPRTFPVTQVNRAIEYDFAVVADWLSALEEYTGTKADLSGKVILELGPGADLGIGLITLLMGAKKYNAMDVNSLVENVPAEFYDTFFRHIQTNAGANQSMVSYLQAQLELTRSGKNDRLNYICRKDFDITVFKDDNIDYIFSQAAFEHFDDVDRTFSLLSKTVRSGSILIAEVDMNTHTRWIRDVDPHNIYRYSQFIYSLFKFAGSPNRVRPYEYKNLLEKYGWDNVKILPSITVDSDYLSKVDLSLNKKFRQPLNQMDCLSIGICATKK